MIKPTVIYKADRVVCNHCHSTHKLNPDDPEVTVCTDDNFSIVASVKLPRFCPICGAEFNMTLLNDLVEGVA